MSTSTATAPFNISPGMRVLIRDQEWVVSNVESNSLGNHAVTCIGVSPLVRDVQATFLDDLDRIVPVDPAKTRFVPDDSPHAMRSHLFVESLLRDSAPTDGAIHVGDRAAMDPLPYQMVPARQALSRPRQRILIADAVGLGKTLEAGILMSELIARHKGRRILVVTAKSMMAQFQKEMWERFTIPLVSLDSARIQRIRMEIPANANPFSYYDKTIVSIDTLKRDIQYGAALDASYWDIIVIDEAQNVADRGTGVRKAQRARLAQRLASRSDTLIMLSATPHDGKPQSFASLMNMLDPTTLPDPEHYTAEQVGQLYVRRFKKDVLADVSGSFPERKVTQIACTASPREEEAFDVLTGLHLVMDTNRKRSNAGLFRTLLEKSLFSSPAACMKTIETRLHRLAKTDPGDHSGDAAKLEELHEVLRHIRPEDFSRYSRLLDMLRSEDYGWSGEDTADRIVIFTERIETKNFLERQLTHDLKLPKGAIVSMDGQMSDVDQQELVEQFGRRTSPIRILIASDVASEGLNLHYLSHRLIHFDTPWSLMVFQQRNGRIDRYGQRSRPDIRFLTIASRNEKIRGDARILEILREKEQQAHDNIGDPSLLMGEFTVEGEEAITRDAIESDMSPEDFASKLHIPDEDIDSDRGHVIQPDETASGDDDDVPLTMSDMLASLLDEDDGDDDEDEDEDEADTTKKNTADETLMDDFSYAWEGLQRPDFKESAGLRSMRPLQEAEGFSVEFDKDSQLRAWLRRHVPDAQVLQGDTGEWSTDAAYCERQASGVIARLRDEDWSRTQYLWALNPLMEWIRLKSTSLLYARDEAPMIGVTNGQLGDDETIVLINGTIANRHAVPIIDEWSGVRYRGGTFAGIIPLDEVWKITGYRGSIDPMTGRRRYVNPAGSTPAREQVAHAESLLSDAVDRVYAMLNEVKQEYVNCSVREITSQLNRIERWRTDRQLLESMRPDAEALHRRSNEIYAEYTGWVTDSLTASGEPVVRVAAAFTGVNR